VLGGHVYIISRYLLSVIVALWCVHADSEFFHEAAFVAIESGIPERPTVVMENDAKTLKRCNSGSYEV
jgi:hypothetical protein